MNNFIQQLSIWAVPILAAIVLHEVAHGYVAYRLGDPTAARMGRLTLNPVAHVDIFGTVFLPLLLLFVNSPFVFGYAKPVPVNYANLRRPQKDMLRVALAGPVTNMALAITSAVALQGIVGIELPADSAVTALLMKVLPPVALMLQASVIMNVVLAVFNMLPILPLDGGRVLAGLLPREHAIAYARLEPFGILIVLVLLATNLLGQVIGPVVGAFLRVLL